MPVTTSETGSDFVAFDDYPAHFVHVLNNTGVSLTFKYAHDNAEFTLPTGAAWSFRGINNAQQLLFKRSDESNSPVTLDAEVEL